MRRSSSQITEKPALHCNPCHSPELHCCSFSFYDICLCPASFDLTIVNIFSPPFSAKVVLDFPRHSRKRFMLAPSDKLCSHQMHAAGPATCSTFSKLPPSDAPGSGHFPPGSGQPRVFLKPGIFPQNSSLRSFFARSGSRIWHRTLVAEENFYIRIEERIDDN